jgi:DtxR family transcriptional regulator, Mn-dependent transcriptional regulator
LKQKVIGYTWDEVHEIAEQLEHVQITDLADLLDKLLNFPQYNPQGESIPKSDVLIPFVSSTTLSDVGLNQRCRIVAVKETSKSFLQYLQKLNISISRYVKIMERITFDGSLIIVIAKSKQTTVSKKFTDNLLVEKI